jgi:hypothetical protein
MATEAVNLHADRIVDAPAKAVIDRTDAKRLLPYAYFRPNLWRAVQIRVFRKAWYSARE